MRRIQSLSTFDTVSSKKDNENRALALVQVKWRPLNAGAKEEYQSASMKGHIQLLQSKEDITDNKLIVKATEEIPGQQVPGDSMGIPLPPGVDWKVTSKTHESNDVQIHMIKMAFECKRTTKRKVKVQIGLPYENEVSKQHAVRFGDSLSDINLQMLIDLSVRRNPRRLSNQVLLAEVEGSPAENLRRAPSENKHIGVPGETIQNVPASKQRRKSISGMEIPKAKGDIAQARGSKPGRRRKSAPTLTLQGETNPPESSGLTRRRQSSTALNRRPSRTPIDSHPGKINGLTRRRQSSASLKLRRDQTFSTTMESESRLDKSSGSSAPLGLRRVHTTGTDIDKSSRSAALSLREDRTSTCLVRESSPDQSSGLMRFNQSLRLGRSRTVDSAINRGSFLARMALQENKVKASKTVFLDSTGCHGGFRAPTKPKRERRGPTIKSFKKGLAMSSKHGQNRDAFPLAG